SGKHAGPPIVTPDPNGSVSHLLQAYLISDPAFRKALGSVSTPTRCLPCPAAHRDWLPADRIGPMSSSPGCFPRSCSTWHPNGHPRDRCDHWCLASPSPIPPRGAGRNLSLSPLIATGNSLWRHTTRHGPRGDPSCRVGEPCSSNPLVPRSQ